MPGSSQFIYVQIKKQRLLEDAYYSAAFAVGRRGANEL
jgi:hypothetical protein